MKSIIVVIWIPFDVVYFLEWTAIIIAILLKLPTCIKNQNEEMHDYQNVLAFALDDI